MNLNRADLRNLLNDALTNDDFDELVFDHFPDVDKKFTSGMTKSRKITLLIEHIETYKKYDNLMEVIRSKNLTAYQDFIQEISILSLLKSDNQIISSFDKMENLADMKYVYLIIELKEKIAQVNEPEHPEYIIIKSLLAIPQGSNQYLHQPINNILNTKTSYTKFEIEDQFIQLITEVNRLIEDFDKNIEPEIIIEWLVPFSLLSSDFELWQQEEQRLCFCHPSIHVRLADRIDIKYRNNRKKWKKRWDNLQKGIQSKSYILAQEQQQMSLEDIERKFSLEAEDTLITGVNFSTDLQKLESKAYRNLLTSGIPLALWSRCKNTDVTHIGDLDNLINPNNTESFNLQNLSSLIQSRRRSTIPNQADDLGYHLCFLLENPYNYPLTKNLNI